MRSLPKGRRVSGHPQRAKEGLTLDGQELSQHDEGHDESEEYPTLQDFILSPTRSGSSGSGMFLPCSIAFGSCLHTMDGAVRRRDYEDDYSALGDCDDRGSIESERTASYDASDEEEESYYDLDESEKQESLHDIHRAIIAPHVHATTIPTTPLVRADSDRVPTTSLLRQGRLPAGNGLFTVQRVACGSSMGAEGYGLPKGSVWAVKMSNVSIGPEDDETKMRRYDEMRLQYRREVLAYQRIACTVYEFERRLGFAFLMELEATFEIDSSICMVFVCCFFPLKSVRKLTYLIGTDADRPPNCDFRRQAGCSGDSPHICPNCTPQLIFFVYHPFSTPFF